MPTITSREIAKITEKRHANVLADIDTKFARLDVSYENNIFIWAEAKYKNRGKLYRQVILNEHAANLLMLGYSSELQRKLYLEWYSLNTKFDARLASRTGCAALTQSIQEQHGPDVQPYHFSNELNLINRVVLGMTAKQFKEAHGVDSVRDALTTDQIVLMEKVQSIDTSLSQAGLSYAERKEILSRYTTEQLALEA